MIDWHVLVVEDQTRQREQLVAELNALNIAPIVAVDAHDAIRKAAVRRPEVILLDGLLPGMHGFEVARFVRHIDPEYRPFIVITTAIYKAVRYENEARLKYGIDMYVMKPITSETLTRILTAAEESRLQVPA